MCINMYFDVFSVYIILQLCLYYAALLFTCVAQCIVEVYECFVVALLLFATCTALARGCVGNAHLFRVLLVSIHVALIA